jgi:hypothetical protein
MLTDTISTGCVGLDPGWFLMSSLVALWRCGCTWVRGGGGGVVSWGGYVTVTLQQDPVKSTSWDMADP